MRLGRSLLCLLAAALILAGCGSSDGSGGSSDATSRPAPPKSDFPTAEGHTMAEVLETATPSKLVVSPAAAVFYTGPNRVPFGVFRADGTQAPDAEVALYFTKAPKNDQKREGARHPGRGPLPGADRKHRDRVGLPLADDQQRGRRGHRRLRQPLRLLQRRRVAGRGADPGRATS